VIPPQDLLDLDALPMGEVHRVRLAMTENGLGEPECIPLFVARGRRPGPVMGLTAALHGNEVNGIAVLQRLFAAIHPESLRGTLVGVLVANPVGYLALRRRFVEAVDLNHSFPGDDHGSAANVFAHRLLHRVVGKLDVLLDLHTASLGRENCLYVRADMSDPRTARMAYLQRPQIIVHNPPHDGTLRGAAAYLGIPAITVEIGDAHRFQDKYIRRTLAGIRAVAMDHGMIPRRPQAPGPEPILCRRSAWVYTDGGGLLHVLPELVQPVSHGEVIARRTNIWGDVQSEVTAPFSGVIVGRSTQPVARTGDRIAHLGELATPADTHLVPRANAAPELAP
jgi:hypothetical protein